MAILIILIALFVIIGLLFLIWKFAPEPKKEKGTPDSNASLQFKIKDTEGNPIQANYILSINSQLVQQGQTRGDFYEEIQNLWIGRRVTCHPNFYYYNKTGTCIKPAPDYRCPDYAKFNPAIKEKTRTGEIGYCEAQAINISNSYILFGSRDGYYSNLTECPITQECALILARLPTLSIDASKQGDNAYFLKLAPSEPIKQVTLCEAHNDNGKGNIIKVLLFDVDTEKLPETDIPPKMADKADRCFSLGSFYNPKIYYLNYSYFQLDNDSIKLYVLDRDYIKSSIFPVFEYFEGETDLGMKNIEKVLQ